MFCPYCGTKVNRSEKTCPSCAYEFRESEDIERKTSYPQRAQYPSVEVDKRDQELEELKQKVKYLEDQVKTERRPVVRQPIAPDSRSVTPTTVPRKSQNQQCCTCFFVIIIIVAVFMFLFFFW